MSKMIKVEKMVVDPVLPVAVIGTKMDGQINFMTASWFTRLEVDPYLFGVSVQKQHFTHKAITENKSFSINILPIDLVPQVDASGMLSGKEHNKEKLFDVFFENDENAPMIKGSILSIECEMVNSLSLVERDESHPRAHTFFVGELKNAWSDEDAIDKNGLDFQKLKPILWTWSPMKYWTIGEEAGQPWNPENKKLLTR